MVEEPPEPLEASFLHAEQSGAEGDSPARRLQIAFGKRLKDGRGGEALGLRGPSEDGWRGGGEKQSAS